MNCIGTPPLSASVRGEIEIQLYTFQLCRQEHLRKKADKKWIFFRNWGKRAKKRRCSEKSRIKTTERDLEILKHFNFCFSYAPCYQGKSGVFRFKIGRGGRL